MINILANNQIFFYVFLFEKTTKFTHNKLKACNILFCLAKKKNVRLEISRSVLE